MPPGCLLIDVGKIPGGRATSQQRINELLIEHAQAGRRVVRFKGGDPFVFGRGGEEAIACAEAGVVVEVVPGVTSAVAGPALAGIPVTHRGVVQAFTVVSGHVPPGHPASTTDWGALARAGHTIVVLMGVANLGAICAELVAHGLPSDTPAAVVADAWLPTMQTVRGTVASIAEVASGVRPPAIVVIGAVAAQELPVTAPAASPSNVPDVKATPTSCGPPGRPMRGTAGAAARLLGGRSDRQPDRAHSSPARVARGRRRRTGAVRNLGAAPRGRLIGSVRGSAHGTDWEIGRLMVAPDLSGQGLGRMLLEHIEAQAPMSVTRFWLLTGANSLRNHRLYRAAGYTAVDAADDSLPTAPGTLRFAKIHR